MGSIDIPLHSDLAKNTAKYQRIKILLENDEDQFTGDTFCLKLPNEPANARSVRKDLFKIGFKNLTMDLLNAIRDSIFREKIRLEFPGDERNPLFVFSEDVTRGGSNMTLEQYAKDVVCNSLRAYGQVWTVIDKPDYQAKNFEDELRHGKPYIQNIAPLQVLNYNLTAGELDWFAYRVKYSPSWVNPTTTVPATVDQIRIWTRNEYYVVQDGTIIRQFPHNFGFVPVVYQSFFLPPDEDTIVGIAPFFSTSNMLIMANNLLSIANMELSKHGNSVLLCHEQALGAMNMEVDAAGTPQRKLQDSANSNMLVWYGEHPPEYLTKDLAAVDKSNQQATDYFLSAIDNERTMRSILQRGTGGQEIAESGVSKAFDAAPILAGLQSTADDLEEWSRKILTMVGRILGLTEPQFVCEYPKRFDIAQAEVSRRLDEIEKMVKNAYPSPTGMKVAFKSITPALTQNSDEQNIINTEIDASEIDLTPDKTAEEEIRKEMLAAGMNNSGEEESSGEEEEEEINGSTAE